MRTGHWRREGGRYAKSEHVVYDIVREVLTRSGSQLTFHHGNIRQRSRLSARTHAFAPSIRLDLCAQRSTSRVGCKNTCGASYKALSEVRRIQVQERREERRR